MLIFCFLVLWKSASLSFERSHLNLHLNDYWWECMFLYTNTQTHSYILWICVANHVDCLSFHFFSGILVSERVCAHASVGFLKCMLRDNQVAINMFDRHFLQISRQTMYLLAVVKEIDLNVDDCLSKLNW